MQDHRVHRRRFLATAGAAAASAALATPTLPWPSRPIECIVPWPAGGATDLTLRILAEGMAQALGQPVVVRNRPGAAGTLVAPVLKEAAADGHTIGQVPVTVYRHALMRRVDWDPLRDLQPIAQVSGTGFGLLVPAGSPFDSVQALLDWARQRPGELTLGSTGIGTTPHLAMEDILRGQGVHYVHVPYKGTADQMLALANGQLMAGMNSTGFAPWVERGQLRLLAMASASRSPRWPQVPTLRELGFEDAVYTSPWGLAAPRGTPTAVVARLQEAVRQAAFEARHRQALERYDQHLEYLDTAQYERAIAATVERERALLARMDLLARHP